MFHDWLLTERRWCPLSETGTEKSLKWLRISREICLNCTAEEKKSFYWNLLQLAGPLVWPTLGKHGLICQSVSMFRYFASKISKNNGQYIQISKNISNNHISLEDNNQSPVKTPIRSQNWTKQLEWMDENETRVVVLIKLCTKAIYW